MKRAFVASSAILLSLLVLVTGCRSGSGDLSKPETQKQFGVRMARMNLWREAMFRFKRSIEIDPSDAMAHNNYAVAAEANGDFDTAAREYREALRLDRSNQYIQKNYSRFVEFTQKSKKRDAAPATTATTTAAPAATATTAATETAAPPPATTTTNPPDGGAS